METLNRHSPSKDATILIVDDDPAAIDALRRILRRNGYANLVGCSRAETALELIERHRPNLVMLDLHMPGMDGFDVLAHIQQHYLPAEAPVTLVVTASDDRASRLRALESVARDYLIKPYDPYEVLLRVNNLLDIQRQGRMPGNILDATPVAMLAQDANGRCTYINRGALNLLGYERAERVVGQDVHALIHHSHADGTPLRREDCPIFSGHETKGETYCWRADGTPLPVSYWSYPLSIERSTGETLLTLVDRREQCESERRSRLANTVFESVDQALVITDAEANIVAVNHAYTAMTGWTAEEVIGRNPRFRRSGRHDAAFYREMWRNLLETDGWQGEVWNLRKDGECYLEEVKIKTVRDPQGRINHFVAALHDLTVARRQTEELETARRNADAANLAKSRFVANMSHEIRTPLTAITGFAETLTESDQSPEQHDRTVNAIIRNSRYLMELVNNILDFSKIESGKLLVEQVETPFEVWIRDIAALAIERARAKGLHFDLNVEAPWPRTLVTDPTRVKQILVNLLNNAFKFTEQGSVRLRVSLDCRHERLAFEVADTGIGIETHRLEELFEAFVQADASTMRQHGGSGLGLNIARTLARRLGGELSVRSVFGVGSQFTATLATGPITESDLERQPLHITSDQAAEAQLLEARIGIQEVRIGGDILLVDDHADNRDLLGHILQQLGVRVFMAENGQQGFERAQGRDFDLILMDMQMPVLDGLNATRLLRMSGFDGPIIALTANTTLEDKQAALEAGCNDFLTKPIDQQLLRETLVRYLPESDSGRPRTREPEPEWTAIYEIPGYEELRQRFWRELPDSLAAMRAARARGDLDTVATLSHQLRGIGSSFGLEEATRLAGIIESRARHGETEVLPSLFNLLEESCQETSS